MRRPSHTRWNCFRPTYRGKNIFDYVLPSSGIKYAPEYEHALVAQYWGFPSVSAFYELSPLDQAVNIAVYRIQNQTEAVITREQSREQKKRSRRK